MAALLVMPVHIEKPVRKLPTGAGLNTTRKMRLVSPLQHVMAHPKVSEAFKRRKAIVEPVFASLRESSKISDAFGAEG